MRQKTLKDYCKKRSISLEDFAKITKVSVAQTYLIARDPSYNINVDTARKIYNGTKRHFGEGLGVWDYIKLEK